MSPDNQKENALLALEKLRIPERRVPIQGNEILEELRTCLGGLSPDQEELARDLLESPIIDIVPLEDLAAMVRNGGRIAHA